MSDAGFGKHETSLSVTYYPEEYYTCGEIAVLLGVSAAEAKELARKGKLKITARNKVSGQYILEYLLNRGEPGFDRLRELGYKGSKKDIALKIRNEIETFSGYYPSLDELMLITSNQGIRIPELNGDRREAKLVLTAILAIAENGRADFKQVYSYCKERLPYPVDRNTLSEILNKRLRAEGLVRKSSRDRTYCLNIA